jgi:hypothetical protein
MTSAITTTTEIRTPADRIDQVRRWIIDGNTEHDIGQAIAATWPDEKPKPLIVAALKLIADSGSVDPDLARGWCFEAYRSLYLKALEAGDFATALRAVKEIGGLNNVRN